MEDDCGSLQEEQIKPLSLAGRSGHARVSADGRYLLDVDFGDHSHVIRLTRDAASHG